MTVWQFLLLSTPVLLLPIGKWDELAMLVALRQNCEGIRRAIGNRLLCSLCVAAVWALWPEWLCLQLARLPAHDAVHEAGGGDPATRCTVET